MLPPILCSLEIVKPGFFYVRNEPQTVRSAYQVTGDIGLAGDPTSDVLIYEEKDPTFSISSSISSKSRWKFMLLNIEGEHTSEVRYLAVAQPTDALKVIEPRRRGFIYEVVHTGDTFIIRTNFSAPDFPADEQRPRQRPALRSGLNSSLKNRGISSAILKHLTRLWRWILKTKKG